MFTEINLPDVGTDKVEVTEILVKEGEKIRSEQLLITVESEKTVMEIVAPCSGKVKEIKVSEGDKIKTGTLVMLISSESNKESKINNIKINKENIKSDDKIHNTINTIQENDNLETNFVFKNKNDIIKNNKYIHASPLIRRLARKFNINLNYLIGSGPKNRIIYEDVQKYIEQAIKFFEDKKNKSSNFLNFSNWSTTNFRKFGPIKKINLTNIQKKTSANLTRNWINIPHVTIMDNIDITDLEIFRKKQNEKLRKKKIKITILTITIKVIGQVLKEMPIFNSSISKDLKNLILKKYIHIGFAVETSKSLVIPVIRNINKKGIIQISEELINLSKKARSENLNIRDTQGSSFTISSLGNIGTNFFTPIINAPEVAILGISRSSIKPIWNGSSFDPRLILPVSLSFDHRIINGADAVRFINRISELINDLRLLNL